MAEQQIQEMQDELERLLMARPETGEAWADICLLEQQIIDAKAQHDEENSQFGVGA